MFGIRRQRVVKRRSTVPDSAVEEATRQIQGLKDRRIKAELDGRCLYISVGGDPLCRFTYEGSDSEWRFALYRYSRGGYSNDVCPYPSSNRIDAGVRVALDIYNLT